MDVTLEYYASTIYADNSTDHPFFAYSYRNRGLSVYAEEAPAALTYAPVTGCDYTISPNIWT